MEAVIQSGLAKVITNNSVVKKKSGKLDIENMRAQDNEKVRGTFNFLEVPGGTLKFPFLKYKGDPVEVYELIDGQQYEVPLRVAKHLNETGWYPVHAYEMDTQGKPSVRVGKKVRRYSFTSSEFIYGNQVDKKIVTIEKIK